MTTSETSCLMKYKYTPIKHPRSIRLLHLHPSLDFETPLAASLHEVSLETSPEYGALSYTWSTEDGDSSLSEHIECDSAVIDITINCDAALRRLRQHDQVRVLWVDAVCIDQSNSDEKSLQIPVMRQIYSQATWVGLWLGETSSDIDPETSTPLSELGMTFLHELALEMAERINSGQNVGGGVLYNELIKDRRAYHEYGVEALTPRVRGLWDILHRRWWARLWVVQEQALAQSAILMCGCNTEAFHNFNVVIDALVKRDQSVEEFEFISTFITTTFHQFYMRNSIARRKISKEVPSEAKPGAKALEILNATRNTKVTDPRDKIYGILGFFGDPESDAENIFPKPDYKTPAAELYADVARAIIVNTDSLSVLSSCYGFLKSSVPDLPSWAASWNDTPLKYFDEDCYSAAGETSAVYEDCGEKTLLRLKGRKFDSVENVCETPKEFEYTHEMCTQQWRQWFNFTRSLQSYPTGESITDVFMNTLCWSSNLQHSRLASGEYQAIFAAWLEILNSADAPDVAARELFQDPIAFTYSRRATFMTYGRIFCTTSKSYLASASMSVSAGDDIVILNGSKVPFIIRAEGSNYKLVGPCYVHGIMDGEAFANEDLMDGGLEWFTFC